MSENLLKTGFDVDHHKYANTYEVGDDILMSRIDHTDLQRL